jgi:hypothetical protein
MVNLAIKAEGAKPLAEGYGEEREDLESDAPGV